MKQFTIRTWLSMGGLLALLADRPPMDNHVRMALRSWFSVVGRDFFISDIFHMLIIRLWFSIGV